jgi:serine/arginine repetitive matrix protein 1
MQINLTGFLNAKRSREFMAELWQMLLTAQKTTDGIPPQLINEKIQQLKKAVRTRLRAM